MSEKKKGPSYQLLGSPTVPLPAAQPVMYQPYGQQLYFMSGTGVNGQLTPPQPVVIMPPPVQVSRPQSFVPNSHLIMTVVLFIILVTFAPETLVLMIPALVLAALSHSANGQGNYLRAKRLGNVALALNISALIMAFVVAITLIISVIISFHPRDRSHHYYGYVDYGCWYDYSYEGSGESPIICYK